MRKYENECVGCPPEMGCLGRSCPNMNVPRDYCDVCGDYAEYTIDGEDYCEKCANEMLNKFFDGLTVFGKTDVLGFSFQQANEKTSLDD